MFHLSDNYYLRKCYLQREQVPTQSMIKKKMKPALAAIYFKSMTPRLKEIAGLEPSLQGGGTDWYVPPKELLEGRAVLKPVKKQILKKLNHSGIGSVGDRLFVMHRKEMDLEIQDAIWHSDINWKNTVAIIGVQNWADLTIRAKKENSENIASDVKYFSNLYKISLDKIETLFHEAAITEIKKTREQALHKMQNNYAAALKTQATTLYDTYNIKLMEEKARLKAGFINRLQICRTDMADKIHDLKVDKHMALHKLKQFLECQNLACQIYVGLKEREEYLKEMNESEHKHRKEVKKMIDNIAHQGVEIRLAEARERKRQELNNIWKKKVCHVVKKFQMFVSYCLRMLPDHADFFINMEKLMLLQVNEALETPNAESIITIETEQFHTPVPNAKPFYLFCDRGYKAHVDQGLCPKPSGNSSISQLPVIIINKRCIYAACDNFEQFTDKIKDFIDGNRGDDADINDDRIYEHFVPVKYTSSQQLLEIKLESSLLQVLEQEIHTLDTELPINQVPIKCNFCEWPRCSCTAADSTLTSGNNKTNQTTLSKTGPKFSSIVRSMELKHENEPKWESFFAHVAPNKCRCAKMVQRHLEEHLPVYMRQMSRGLPEIPNYEMCSVLTLKTLVKEARKEPAVSTVKVSSKNKDIGTQCSDVEYDLLCNCLSVGEADSLLNNLRIDTTMMAASSRKDERVIYKSGDLLRTFMTQSAGSFATARARSLRNLIKSYPDIQDIFKK